MMNMREIEMKIRRKVLGDNYVDCAAAATTDFDRPLQDLVVDAAWGHVWAGPNLGYANALLSPSAFWQHLARIKRL